MFLGCAKIKYYTRFPLNELKVEIFKNRMDLYLEMKFMSVMLPKQVSAECE